MEQIVCLEIDFGVRLLSLIIELDNLVDRNAIRTSSISGPSVSFVNSVMSRRLCPFDIYISKKRTILEGIVPQDGAEHPP